MALDINPKVLGQEVTDTTTYCYLYEPLEVSILEQGDILKNIEIDLEVISTETGIPYEVLTKYASYDINEGSPVVIDLMGIAKQYHDANVYKLGLVDDIVGAKDAVVSKYKYNFKIVDKNYISDEKIENGEFLTDSGWNIVSTGSPSQSSWTIGSGTANFVSDISRFSSLFDRFLVNVSTNKTLTVSIDVESISETVLNLRFYEDNPSVKVFDVDITTSGIHTYELEVSSNSSIYVTVKGRRAIGTSGTSEITLNSISAIDPTYATEATYSTISKLPIVGGRDFQNFEAEVDENVPTNEFEKYGIDETYLSNKWANVQIIKTVLKTISGGNSLPTITRTPSTGTKEPCAFLIWKSRYGGWMYWGFELEKETSLKKYDGSLQVSLFEATGEFNGSTYVPVDFTGITTSYKRVLKSLDLTQDELRAVDGINSSPICYYMKPNSEKVELMRVSSADVPLDSSTDGGDFQVTLSSISQSAQKTI